MGWQIVARWPMFVKVLRPFRLLVTLLRRNSPTPGPLSFNSYFGPEIMTWQAFVSRYRSEISELLANWEHERIQVGLRTPRNLAYLAWRYGQHPHVPYGVYALADSQRLTAFAILRPNVRYGLKEIVLTELVLPAPHLQPGRRLLKQLRRQLKGDYLIAHFAAGTAERKLLRQSGFFRVPRQGMIFTARPLNIPTPQVLHPIAWDLSLGDLELF